MSVQTTISSIALTLRHRSTEVGKPHKCSWAAILMHQTPIDEVDGEDIVHAGGGKPMERATAACALLH